MSAEESANEERYYPSKEVCDRLDIASSTLRKWCIKLEEHGYSFARTEQKRRLFTAKDLEALDSLKVLIQEKHMSLENATIIVTSRFIDNEGTRSSSVTPSVRQEIPSRDDVIEALNRHIQQQETYQQQQEKFNQELLKRLDEQNKFINDKLEHHTELMNESLKRAMVEQHEDIKRLEDSTKKEQGFLARLFGKK